MVSNDVEALGRRRSCEALLLTPKARVIAPMVVLRRGADDFLLLTEAGLGERLRDGLLRMRFAAKCEIETEEHVRRSSSGARSDGDSRPRTTECRGTRCSTTDSAGRSGTRSSSCLRIRAGTPRFGREIDDRVLPGGGRARERAIDFEKGCYPGQEPIARQHYRGRVNRTLRVLAHRRRRMPEYDAELDYEGKAVGRVTSAARDGDASWRSRTCASRFPPSAPPTSGGARRPS